MKEEIKNLRVRIDGISQLVKELKDRQCIININSIPESIDLKEFMTTFNNGGNLFIDKKTESDIQILPTHEVSKCYNSLILSKAWLGKVLGELGEETPYKNDGNRRGVEDIESPADISNIIHATTNAPNLFDDSIQQINGWENKNYIEKVDWLREEIGKVFKSWKELNIIGMRWTQVVSFEQHIQEARFWLGFGLQRIKEQDNGK